MQTKLLMTLSAALMGALGLVFTFAPDEVLQFVGGPTGGFGHILTQIAGALYFGFAMINWMVRDHLFGGIYGRPVVVGNLAHFAMVSLVLLRSVLKGEGGGAYSMGLAVYALLAIWFGLVMFRHPGANTKK